MRKYPYRNILSTLCALPLLAACSYFDSSYFDTGYFSSDEAQEEQSTDNGIERLGGMAATPEDMRNDARQVVLNSTQGRVRIFSLGEGDAAARSNQQIEGGASPRVINAAPVALPGGGQPQPSYRGPKPNVEIFSLDGGTVAPSLAPISSGYGDIRAQDAYSGGQKMVLYFEHDSATLDAADLREIDSAAQYYSRMPGRTVNVEGHASINANYNDQNQKKIVNLKVSMDRAFAVSQALIKRGVPAASIRMMAWGDAKAPMAVNGKNAQSAARRVEISG